MTVTVTAKDITDGVKLDGEHCPVALALRRATSHNWEVFEWWTFNRSLEIAKRTPDNVRTFIENFDKGRPVRPFTFQLEG